jgi:hypothetical protein
MLLSGSNTDVSSTGLLFASALVLCTARCFPAPEGPLVEGPTLSTEIGSVSEADIAGTEVVAAAPIDEASQRAHANFLAANVIGSERVLALRGARIRLRPGTGVEYLADAFVGLMIFVAPESDRTARVFLASAVPRHSAGPLELGLMATRLEYEGAQSVLSAPRFIVGVSGPTPLGSDRPVEFGLHVELELAIVEIKAGGGGH